MVPCKAADLELIEAASGLLRERYDEEWHEIAAALRTRNGRLFAAVNLNTSVKRMAICAEAVAVGMAVADGDADIETVVAVNRAGRVVSPCGACREMLADYALEARMIVPGSAGPEVVKVVDLLPRPYRKYGRPRPRTSFASSALSEPQRSGND